jgi:hypothetical protein
MFYLPMSSWSIQPMTPISCAKLSLPKGALAVIPATRHVPSKSPLDKLGKDRPKTPRGRYRSYHLVASVTVDTT